MSETTEALAELNDRWRAMERAHAVPRGTEGWVMFCPRCDSISLVALPLFSAMNDALTHSKVHCPEIH
jgi:hypothetical protein